MKFCRIKASDACGAFFVLVYISGALKTLATDWKFRLCLSLKSMAVSPNENIGCITKKIDCIGAQQNLRSHFSKIIDREYKKRAVNNRPHSFFFNFQPCVEKSPFDFLTLRPMIFEYTLSPSALPE